MSAPAGRLFFFKSCGRTDEQSEIAVKDLAVFKTVATIGTV
jgi:hypothetical protein